MSKNRYVIIHGQFYEMSEDELMHWKYIKREKKNGRWVYYYDEKGTKLDRAKARMDKAQSDVESAKNSLNGLYDQYWESMSLENALKKPDDPSKLDTHKTELAYNTRANYTNKKIKQAAYATMQYGATRIATFPARTISKGAIAVANFISNAIGSRKKKKP